MAFTRSPEAQGLYNPRYEHDGCGVAFIAHLKGEHSRSIVENAIEILERLEHRGGVGANPTTGDGAGMLMDIPHDFFASDLEKNQSIILPEFGQYGILQLFMPQNQDARHALISSIEKIAADFSLTILAWRDVPVDRTWLNEEVQATEPYCMQAYFKLPVAKSTENNPEKIGDIHELILFFARQHIEKHACKLLADNYPQSDFYIQSFSARTIVYKGMFSANQIAPYYKDFQNSLFCSSVALVHQRYSTNTFPAWRLAHPYRVVAHNGEINTLRGNVNNIRARCSQMKLSETIQSQLNVFGNFDLQKIFPLIDETQSDTACFDNVLELLMLSGYTLQCALSMMMPVAWQNRKMSDKVKTFFQYYGMMMEPWDGPAQIVAYNGKYLAACLDRNGLRPGRIWQLDDDVMVMASEAGVLQVSDSRIVRKMRMAPGKLLLLDLRKGKIIEDEQVKESMATEQPYKHYLKEVLIDIDEIKTTVPLSLCEHNVPDDLFMRWQEAFGYNQETYKFILSSMLHNGEETISSMGDDTPIATLSERPRLLYDYFRQEFAQVTNPAIDPIREKMVMSLDHYLGKQPNILHSDKPAARLDGKLVRIHSPFLSSENMQRLYALSSEINSPMLIAKVNVLYPIEKGEKGLAELLEDIVRQAIKCVKEGANILIISDIGMEKHLVAAPMLLCVSAIHHGLLVAGLRTQVGLIAQTGSTITPHQYVCLFGYGAQAVYPYLAYKALDWISLNDEDSLDKQKLIDNYRKALDKSLLKVMSKMGISTFQSYCGAQVFELLGISRELADQYFPYSITQIEGIKLADVHAAVLALHQKAFKSPLNIAGKDIALNLSSNGDYAFRVNGEKHLWTPHSISKLQHSVRSGNYSTYKEYSELINNQSKQVMTLRGLLEIIPAKAPVDISEVESAECIVKRFSTGAMSFGSISWEAHTTLALAMNQLGGKSNTGEGGELAERFERGADGKSMRSAIKQIASGRFGVTSEYLANSDVLQIKIAQGAKPGEGGQLPGHKVDQVIARTRYSVPGVGLISPPPHHDIYSIEDIAQLIHDLKCANPKAQISVKLVSRYGVGTVAVGVVKGKSDQITIAGHDGGTGASALSSIKHAGTPWELGLSDTHQTLLLNDLRGRTSVQVDGQLKTGRDVVIGALLGADEFGFATAPLVAEGCLMMRKCHLNTCPVGIATQNPELRKKFAGKAEHIVNYFFFVAEEVRELMALMGYRKFTDMIGRTDCLRQIVGPSQKSKQIDLSLVLHQPKVPESYKRFCSQSQNHQLHKELDNELIDKCKNAIEAGQVVHITSKIQNSNRSVGAMLSYEIATRYGYQGLVHDTIRIHFAGVSGQSFGGFLAKGITLELEGEANDYVGKGLSGGIISIFPPTDIRIDGENVIAGNTLLYGAVSGQCYLRGLVGERFAVRNSGAIAVVEGVGDHCCEYMTGGVVVVIGPTGVNFAAGMSGGVAYVFVGHLSDDPDKCRELFSESCNLDMVQLEEILMQSSQDNYLLGYSDEELIVKHLRNHYIRTGSAKAKQILDTRSESLRYFVKVMPKEYRLALEQALQEAA